MGRAQQVAAWSWHRWAHPGTAACALLGDNSLKEHMETTMAVSGFPVASSLPVWVGTALEFNKLHHRMEFAVFTDLLFNSW